MEGKLRLRQKVRVEKEVNRKETEDAQMAFQAWPRVCSDGMPRFLLSVLDGDESLSQMVM